MTRKIVTRNPASVAVLGFMMAHADNKGVAEISIPEISRGLRLNPTNVKKHLQWLQRHEDLKRIGETTYICAPLAPVTY